jgi:hypothetical protein
MNSLFRRKPSHATVVAYLALFVALGGSSYAAVKVGSKQIVNNTVSSTDVRNNSLTSKDVHDRSLLAKDFKTGQLPRGDTGPRGLTGDPGSPAGSVIQGNTTAALLTLFGSEERFSPSGYSAAAPGFTGAYWSITPNVPLVVRDLVGRVASAPGTGSSRYVQLYNVDANTTPLSCVILNNETSCNTGDASVTLPPRTRIAIRLFTGNPGPAPSQGAAWSFRTLTP